MIIANGEENSIKAVQLPPSWAFHLWQDPVQIRQLAADAEMVTCQASALQSRNGRINRLLLSTPANDAIVIASREPQDLFEANAKRVLIVHQRAEIENSVLILARQHSWHRHPRLTGGKIAGAAAHARDSWVNALSFVAEDVETKRPGLRPPQIGALHAIAAHWTVSQAPALVVMPTGTGKTEVMLATLVMRRPHRLLVIVPSDLLREQTFDKFTKLGVLRAAGVLPNEIVLPVVGAVHGTLDATAIKRLDDCNVVVATMAAVSGMGIMQLRKFTALFDLVFFDEAHHLPAASWERLNELLAQHCVLQFTATPFRLDGRRIPGRIIYNFPLRLAQEQKYFQEIDFVEVIEVDELTADQKIAEAAVARLRADRTASLDHLLLARADTKVRAEALFAQIYSAQYADLNPVLIHSETLQRREKLDAIRARKHLIVVCVDMFGEGYDLPQLKIAALHDVHKSLAVTLQFTGRFTRTAPGLGKATIVANIADPRVSDAIEELYAEDSDWNQLIPKLSARAIQSQLDFSDFLQRMEKSDLGDDELFSLNVLRPKTSTVMYRVPSFSPRQFRPAIKKGTHVQRVWISKEKDFLVLITRTRAAIDWATIKEASDEIWDLYVVAHDTKHGLLYIHSSQTGSLHDDLANAVGGGKAKLVAGEVVFRALSGLKRITLQNVGLKPRGNKLRFHMFVGPDVVDMITPAAQMNAAKSNLFALGYDEGKKVSVGVSTKGRMWSRASGSIPDWRAWCERIAVRVLDAKLPTDEFLKHTMVPREIADLPGTPIFAVALPAEWFHEEMDTARFFVNAKEIDLHLVGLTRWSATSTTTLDIELSAEQLFAATFELKWGPGKGEFVVEQKTGPTVELRYRGHQARFHDYLLHAPPTVFLADGSEINGGLLHAPPQALEHTLDLTLIDPWDWTGIDLTSESLWKNGVKRANSIQGRVLEVLAGRSNKVVFDDDDAGESADVIEVVEHGDEVIFRFYHCKYSQAATPGERAKDLYEVCGQAVRSTRWHHDAANLVAHLQRRAGKAGLNGRTSRFNKGDEKDLIQLKRKVRQVRVRYEVSIVQPGLSKTQLEPQTTTILGAANNFLLEMTGTPLRVVASK